jgi:anaerobic magnesium-protoporphyrin IX monomethyl ester cyclase
MRVAFIIPDKTATKEFADTLFDYQCEAVHQGIGYIAAYAKSKALINECITVRTSDMTKEELTSFLEQGWDVIGITLTIFALQEAADLCSLIKQKSCAKIVLGGPEVTTIKEDIFKSCGAADYAIYGEGEITFSELLDCLKNKGSFQKIKGLIYQNELGEPIKNGARSFIDNLSIFSYPDRTIFKYHCSYHSIIGTRGCPYRCNFCNSSQCWGYRHRLRDPKSIYDELKYILTLYNDGKLVIFDDDSFNINENWVKSICRLIKHLKVSWRVRGIRAGLITEEVADSLAEAGCIGVSCGVESANNDSLRAMHKGSTIEEILRGVAILQKRGIPVVGNFMIGNIGDTLDAVQESVRHASLFSQADFRITYPMPYTDLYNYLEANNLFLSEPILIKYGKSIIGRIIFETPGFSIQDRIKAINIALDKKLLHNVEYN